MCIPECVSIRNQKDRRNGAPERARTFVEIQLFAVIFLPDLVTLSLTD